MDVLANLRAAFDEAGARMTDEMVLAREGVIRQRPPPEIRADASSHVPAIVAELDDGLVRRLAAAMQVVLNQDVPGNLLPWYERLDVAWARKVVARGSSALLDRVLELVASADRSLEQDWA